MTEAMEPMLLTTLGEVEVWQVPETTIATSVRWILGGASDDEIEAARNGLDPVFFDENGRLVQSIHTYLLKSRGRAVLIDTGVGNGKSRGGRIPQFDMLETPFLERLESTGVRPDDVDLVLCTHMHTDHLGWDAYRDGPHWKPTFPRARHLFVEREHEAFMEQAGADEGTRQVREDTIDPLIEADLIDLVAADHRVTHDIRLEPSQGHTPGHVNIVVEGGGRTAVFIGDVMHNPIQVLAPDAVTPLNGPPAATAMRKQVIAKYADTDVMVFGAHFSRPCGGYVRRMGTGYTFVPIGLG